MKFYIPPTIKSDFEDWLNTDVANVNYDFEIIRDWYDQAAVKRIRATYFPIAWKSKIGNSDANSNFKTGYGWEIRKGDIVVREDGTIYMLNWQAQRNPNNQSTQAIACNARLSFARHMDEVLTTAAISFRKRWKKASLRICPACTRSTPAARITPPITTRPAYPRIIC